MPIDPNWTEGTVVRAIFKNKDPDTLRIIVDALKRDEDGDLYLPHACHISNCWNPGWTPEDDGWDIHLYPYNISDGGKVAKLMGTILYPGKKFMDIPFSDRVLLYNTVELLNDAGLLDLTKLV